MCVEFATVWRIGIQSGASNLAGDCVGGRELFFVTAQMEGRSRYDNPTILSPEFLSVHASILK